MLRQWAMSPAVKPELPMVKLRPLFEIPDHLARLLQHGGIEAIQKNCCCSGLRLPAKFFGDLAGLKSAKIDQANGKIRLFRQVQPEIGFVHGCSGVMSHRRMAVDAIDLASRSGEEMAEEEKPAKVRRAYADGNRLCSEDFPADLKRPPDAAAVRRRIEGGTDFVVHDPRSQFAHASEDRGQMCIHPLRRVGSRIAGEANSLAIGEARQLRGRWCAQKEDAGYDH